MTNNFLLKCFCTGQSAPILALYNLDGDEEIVVTVGREISIFYEGIFDDDNYISFEANIDDGEYANTIKKLFIF